MDIFDEEIAELFSVLHKNSVKYILIGGFATALNGYYRLTEDIDIWIEDSITNRKKLRKALNDLGLPDMPQIESIDFIPGWSGITLPTGFELDVMTRLSGFEQEKFEECYTLSNEAILSNTPVRFFHINQLIAAKKASNRPKDQLDIEELEKIKNKSNK